MIVNGPTDHFPGEYPRAESAMILTGDLLDAAMYPEEVLKSAVTLLRAHVDQDVSACEDTHAQSDEPFLLLLWVQPLDEHTEDEELEELKDEGADGE